MPFFAALILISVCSGCSSWSYPDETTRRAMNYQTPETGEPTVTHGSTAISDYPK
jgi:hypothetical protein